MNPTLATPSAKSHERVTGRWNRDLKAESPREWAIYYAKTAFGTPIPWLMLLIAASIFTSRAALEIASWSVAGLTACYIVADRLSSNREFHFFRVGYDFALLAFLIVGILSVLSLPNVNEMAEGIGNLRWVVLLYLFVYCWELFPGLNRVFSFLMGFAIVTAGYGIWQHFFGMDILRMSPLAAAPLQNFPFFSAVGFFRSPEIFGTLLATLLPLTSATFLQADRRDLRLMKWSALAATLILVLAIFWTYRMGMWLSAGLGVLVVLILQSQRPMLLIGSIVVMIMTVIVFTHGSPDVFFSDIQMTEIHRADLQRTQINSQVEIWQKNIWFGTGLTSEHSRSFDATIGNVYFTILAQTGLLGLAAYAVFMVGFLMGTYRIWQEIPKTHFWHRVLVSGGMASQISFHSAGLYWNTLSEAHTMNLFVLILASLCYLTEHYTRGLVPDDYAL